MSERWYVLHVAPGYDILIHKWIKWFGMSYHQFHTTITRGRRKTDIVVSAYPGYVFVKFDVDADRWQMLHDVPGVIKLFSCGPENPLALPDGVMEDLMEYHDHKNAQPIKLSATPIVAGAQLKILNGPFTSFTGTCINSTPDFVKMMVDVFGRTSPVTLKRNDVMENA